jgi:hypothetical protein
MTSVFFVTGITLGNVPPMRPKICMMSEIVWSKYRGLKKLRENSYSLKMLVRTFVASGLVLSNIIATYLKKLELPRERPPPKAPRTGTVVAPTVELRTKHFQMKVDKLLQERSNVWQGCSS